MGRTRGKEPSATSQTKVPERAGPGEPGGAGRGRGSGRGAAGGGGVGSRRSRRTRGHSGEAAGTAAFHAAAYD